MMAATETYDHFFLVWPEVAVDDVAKLTGEDM
jgi:hypothetical protein